MTILIWLFKILADLLGFIRARHLNKSTVKEPGTYFMAQALGRTVSTRMEVASAIGPTKDAAEDALQEVLALHKDFHVEKFLPTEERYLT